MWTLLTAETCVLGKCVRLCRCLTKVQRVFLATGIPSLGADMFPGSLLNSLRGVWLSVVTTLVSCVVEQTLLLKLN